MNKWLINIFPLLLVAPAVLALLYVDGLLYPHVTLKTLLFRGIGIMALAVFAYLVTVGHSFYWSRLRNKLTWIPGGLLVVAYITSVLGVDFYHSFWSTFDRGDGLLTLSTGVMFFYLTILYSNREFFSKLLKTIAWTGTAVALYALLQWMQGVSGVEIPLITEPRGRIGGTFGNAAFLAGYLAMTLFVTLMLAHDVTKKWQNAIRVSIALQALVIFLTATRGTILALFVVGFVSLVYKALQRNVTTARMYARIAIVAVLILSSLFFVFRAELAESPFEPISRVASISFQDGTVASRLFVWKEVSRGALERPLLGYGAEHVDTLFNRAYDPDKIVEQWFDRSHNSFLDYFVQYGIIGLLLYLGVIFTLGFAGFKIWRRGDTLGVYLMAMTGVYVIQNFFVFDTSMTLWMLFAVTAVALVISDNNNDETSIKTFSHAHLVGGVIAVLIAVLAIPVSLTPLRANMLLADGYKYHIADVKKAVEKMEKGLSLDTYADLEYGYQAYVMYTERQIHMLDGEERVIAYEYAHGILTENLKKYPYDARTATYLAHVMDLTPSEIVQDEETLLLVIEQAIELTPKRTQLWFIKANISIRKGDVLGGEGKVRSYREAISILEEFAERVPENSESRYILASLQLAILDRDNATRLAEEGATLYRGNLDTANRAMSYYLNIEDWVNAKRFLTDIIEEESDNYDLIYDLAKLHFLTGDIEKSLELVEQIRQESPGLVETDPVFVQAIEGL